MTADLADFVLRVHGPRLRTGEIMAHMIEEGWLPTGNRRRDYKNLFQNLSTKKNRFRNLGNGLWERVEEAR